MGSLRPLTAWPVLALTLGCNALSGLGDLEKVDCVEGCAAGGAGGAGGSAGDGGALTALALGVGRKTSCVVLSDESLWCWGANPGVEPGTLSTEAVRVTSIGAVSQVVVGLEHVCALDDTGTVWCWGRNDSGQLGDGTTAPSAIPKAVPGLPAIDTLSIGASHSCAYTSPDTLPVQAFCWGDNAFGQLGDGTTNDSPLPIKIELSDGAQVFRMGPGDGYTCAVVDDAGTFEARCWGKNDKGQCGIDPSAQSVVSTPTPVPGLPSVERVYPGFAHVCSRTTGTRVPYCWGANEHGQVGINTTSAFEPPAQVIGSLNIDTMSPGYRHTCLLTQNAQDAYCWGANDLGQFSGTPSGVDQPLPSPEPALDGIGFSMRQSEHGCAQFPGAIRCWGANDSGQLGNGKTEPYGAATDVIFAP